MFPNSFTADCRFPLVEAHFPSVLVEGVVTDCRFPLVEAFFPSSVVTEGMVPGCRFPLVEAHFPSVVVEEMGFGFVQDDARPAEASLEPTPSISVGGV